MLNFPVGKGSPEDEASRSVRTANVMLEMKTTGQGDRPSRILVTELDV